MLRSSSLHGLPALQFLIDSLHSHSFQLESLFRYLDVDGDGSVSVIEFEHGIRALAHLLHRPLLDRETTRILTLLDADGDGEISYAEFFAAFRLLDTNLSNTQKRVDEMNALRRSHSDSTVMVNLMTTMQHASNTNTASPSSIHNPNANNGNMKIEATAPAHSPEIAAETKRSRKKL